MTVTLEKSYRRSVNVLRPNKARMAAIHAEYSLIHSEAVFTANAMLSLGNKTARELYEAACAIRSDNETELAEVIRVVLMGLARKEDYKNNKNKS